MKRMSELISLDLSNKRCFFLIGIFILLISLSSVSAKDFKLGANSSSYVEKTYLGGDTVRGKLNISFTNQENVDFESDFEGGIELLELLKVLGYNSSKGDFECDPLSCEDGFSVISGSEGSSKDVAIKGKKFYGLEIRETSKVQEIKEGFEFLVRVPVGNNACTNQIYIDLFDDGTIDFYNRNMKSLDVENGVCTTAPYQKDFGCFDKTKADGTAKISSGAYYCQVINNLPPAPAYRVGANINKLGGTDSLKFRLFDYPYSESGPLGEAELTEVTTGEVSAIINHSSIEKFDALVCLWSPNGNGNNYEINIVEDQNLTCGGQFAMNTVSGNLNLAFEIFAQPMAFGPIGDFTFNASLYEDITGRDLTDDLDNYVQQRYGDNCSEGCVIPWSVWGEENLGIRFESGNVAYQTSVVKSENQFHELQEEGTKISSGYIMLDLAKMNFEVPNSGGSQNFILTLGDEEVFREKISVSAGFDFTINPKFALVGRTTQFNAFSTMSNISKSTWNFGDGTPLVSAAGKSAQHVYLLPGNYEVVVTLTRQTGMTGTMNSTKRFEIVVGEPKISANLTLQDYSARIENIKSEIGRISNQWLANSLKTTLKLEDLEKAVATQSTDFSNKARAANTKDEDYIPIINALLELNVPRSIFVSENGILPGEIGFNNIDIGHLERISNSETESEVGARDAVIVWMNKNYGLQIDFQTISQAGEQESSQILRWYKISISQKAGADKSAQAYLIVDHPKSAILLKAGTDLKDTPGGAYQDIDGAKPVQNIEFIIIGSDPPEVSELGIYISPALNRLVLTDKPIRESWMTDEEGNFDWGRFIIGISLLLASTLFVYILLQSWYKRYYEKKLFKNSADLYNLINFIYNSRKTGIQDNLVKEKLKERKWSGEQITYAFNKLEGKRTGMWEIPLFKFVENKKVKKEIEKKQKEKVDRRFIKQTGV